MTKLRSVSLSLLALLFTVSDPAHSQTTNICQTKANKLGCLIPNLLAGEVVQSTTHQPNFPTGDFEQSLTSVGTGIATQLSSLPIPSTASGFTYALDPVTGVYSRSSQSFGPILTERAETIGKHKFLFGYAYQQFNLTTLDGSNLHNLGVVFKHRFDPDLPPDYLKDVITADNNIDLKVRQSTALFTYGLTDTWDVSVAVPILNVHLGVASADTIQRIGTQGATDESGMPIHFFPGTSGSMNQKQFMSAGDATGLGDIVFRTKHTIKQWERSKLAFVMDVRVPTGDEYNYLGSGAVGLKPFFAFSTSYGRISPHFNLGYQWNGKSVLAGDLQTGYKRHLPSQIPYAAGFDVGVARRLTFGFDVIGQELINADRIVARRYTQNGADFADVSFTKGMANITNGAVGIKLNPVGGLLLNFNLLFKMNNAGLRSDVAPLVGVTYSW